MSAERAALLPFIAATAAAVASGGARGLIYSGLIAFQSPFVACIYSVPGPTSEAGGVLEGTEEDAPRLGQPGSAPVTRTALNSVITHNSEIGSLRSHGSGSPSVSVRVIYILFIDKSAAMATAGPVW